MLTLTQHEALTNILDEIEFALDVTPQSDEEKDHQKILSESYDTLVELHKAVSGR